MSVSIRVDAVSDVVCPWCLVGLQRLDNAVARLDDGVGVIIEHHPFLLDPDVAEDGEDLVAHLTNKYGRPPDAMWGRLEAEARRSGLEVRLADQPMRYPTLAAHTLLRHARAKGTQHRLERALAHAYFLEIRNISDAETLAEIATGHGFARHEALALLADADEAATTRAEAAAIAAQGITGVPLFIFNRRLAVSGCQPEEMFDRALAAALDEAVAEAAPPG